MTTRPYVLLSSAVSADGCLDGTAAGRLVISGAADLDRVDAERAAADAIMVGAGTVRRDDPRLLIRSPERTAARTTRGQPAHPLAVTVTASGDIDPGARFLDPGRWRGTQGRAPGSAPPRLVYCASPVAAALRRRLDGLAEVSDAGPSPSLAGILADLASRGVGRLLVEGGADLGRRLLTAGLVDELHLVIGPFFVGDAAAPRFAGPGHYPHGPAHPMVLAEARPVGEVVLLRYLLPSGTAGAPGEGGEVTAADRRWLRWAVELSRRCPPSATAYAVGAVLVAADGTLLATGYSREGGPHDHAEEAALAKLDPADPRLPGATLYSSLEPCRVRASRPRPCADLVIAAGLRRVVIAWLEPPVLAPGGGAARLRDAGVTVAEVPALASEARAVNADVLGGGPPPAQPARPASRGSSSAAP